MNRLSSIVHEGVGGLSPVLAALCAVGCLTLSPATAQETDPDSMMPDPEVPQGENLQVPEGWRFRLDSPDEGAQLVAAEEPDPGDIRFVNMTPGWHVTTGPPVILYHPASRAEGDFRASATFHLFPPGRRNEAFGLFVGGRDLDGPDQRYLYFLIRRTGEYLVKLRDGGDTRVIIDWTAHDSVVPHDEETEVTATNTLAVEARGDTLRFTVNGVEVASRPRADLPVDGLVGWRINHRLNLHVTAFSVETLE